MAMNSPIRQVGPKAGDSDPLIAINTTLVTRGTNLSHVLLTCATWCFSVVFIGSRLRSTLVEFAKNLTMQAVGSSAAAK